MPVRTVLGVEEGAPIVRQVADGDDAAGLEASAAALIAAAGPGVVEVIRSGPVEEGWELVTAHAGSPVGGARLGDAGTLAAVGAAVAATLAVLHGRDLVHGRLAARHVLVGPAGPPRLCGLAALDVATAAGAPGDVAALARVLAAVAAELPAASSRSERERRQRLAARLADAAASPPTARRLASDLRGLAGRDPGLGAAGALGGRRVPRTSSSAGLGAAGAVGGRRVPRTSSSAGLGAAGAVGGRRVPRTSTAPRALAVGLGAVAAVLLLVGVVGRRWSPTAATAPTATTAPATTSGPASTTTLLPSCVVGTRVPVARPPDGGACPHAVSVDGRGAVLVDGRRSVVGRRGDELLVGDWGCQGVAPAVLRPATGEVLVYGPLGDGPPVVVLAERVEGARGLSPGVDEGGCPTLSVLTDEGGVRLT